MCPSCSNNAHTEDNVVMCNFTTVNKPRFSQAEVLTGRVWDANWVFFFLLPSDRHRFRWRKHRWLIFFTILTVKNYRNKRNFARIHRFAIASQCEKCKKCAITMSQIGVKNCAWFLSSVVRYVCYRFFCRRRRNDKRHDRTERRTAQHNLQVERVGHSSPTQESSNFLIKNNILFLLMWNFHKLRFIKEIYVLTVECNCCNLRQQLYIIIRDFLC